MDTTLETDAVDAPSPPATARQARLAELVVHLTGCPAPLAVAAVERAAGERSPATDVDGLLAVVAEAMLTIKRIDLRDRLDLT